MSMTTTSTVKITNPMPRRYPNILLRRTWRSYGYDIVSLVDIYWIDVDIDVATNSIAYSRL